MNPKYNKLSSINPKKGDLIRSTYWFDTCYAQVKWVGLDKNGNLKKIKAELLDSGSIIFNPYKFTDKSEEHWVKIKRRIEVKLGEYSETSWREVQVWYDYE
jgi:hypothetical protein